jgi:NitT/TauT family transport system ATP-binding protein
MSTARRIRPSGSSPEAGAGLRLSGVHREFSGRAVIEDLDLDIRRGEFLALLGPSGCGKSTLLRLIAGLDRPDAGRLSLGDDIRRLAYVFQDASLMPWRTVLGNVALPLELAGTPRAERDPAARRWLENVGLAEAAERYPNELSGGMKMRVSLARALVNQPTLLLLDEPFAALDEFTRQHLDELLQSLWQVHAMTVIFVTHSLMEAVFLADRVVMLAARGGRLLADRTVELGRPRTRATRTSVEFNRTVELLSAMLHEGWDSP